MVEVCEDSALSLLLSQSSLVCTATVLTAIGARRAAHHENGPFLNQAIDQNDSGSPASIGLIEALSLPFQASIFLVAAYMLFTRLQGILVIISAIASAYSSGLAIQYIMPVSKTVSILLGSILVLLWLSTGHWLIVDILAASIFLATVVALRIPNLKIGCLTLSSLFLYDIFWVFFSPYFFGESLMISVANQSAQNPARHISKAVGVPTVDFLELPIKFLFPLNFFCPHEKRFRLLGLGDLAVPALLIALAARFDSFLKVNDHQNIFISTADDMNNPIIPLTTNSATMPEVRQRRRRPPGGTAHFLIKDEKSSAPAQYASSTLKYPSSFLLRSSKKLPSYTTIALLAYFFGLSSASYAAEHFEHAQPALLYLVPAVLIAVIVTASLHGRDHMNYLWFGFEEDDEEEEEDEEKSEANQTSLATREHTSTSDISSSISSSKRTTTASSYSSSLAVLSSSSVSEHSREPQQQQQQEQPSCKHNVISIV